MGGGGGGQHFLSFGEFCEKCATLQILFKCLDFAQTCCQNAGNAISETQISNIFRGGMSPYHPVVAIFEFRPRW